MNDVLVVHYNVLDMPHLVANFVLFNVNSCEDQINQTIF